MKKENKKMAQERRAAERKKQARMKLIRNTVIVVVIVGFFAFMIIYGILDAKKNSSEDTSSDVTTEETTDTSDTGTDTSDTDAKTSYATDTSLVVAEGDTVNIDYSGTIDGFQFDGGTDTGYDLTIGSHTFIDDFEEQLIGHNVGETVEVTVNFPEDYGRSYTDANGEEQSFNGVEAVFTVVINGIYEE